MNFSQKFSQDSLLHSFRFLLKYYPLHRNHIPWKRDTCLPDVLHLLILLFWFMARLMSYTVLHFYLFNITLSPLGFQLHGGVLFTKKIFSKRSWHILGTPLPYIYLISQAWILRSRNTQIKKKKRNTQIAILLLAKKELNPRAYQKLKAGTSWPLLQVT